MTKSVQRLKVIFPAWKQAIPDQDAYNGYRKELYLAFLQSGIRTPKQIELGLDRARVCKQPWYPSVGQFAEWCQVDARALGLPDPEQAYLDAAHYRWDSHPIVYLAAKAVGVYEVRTVPEDKIKPRYLRAYARFVKRIIDGETFENTTDTFQGIEAGHKRIEQKPVTPEESNASRLKALRMLGIQR